RLAEEPVDRRGRIDHGDGEPEPVDVVVPLGSSLLDVPLHFGDQAHVPGVGHAALRSPLTTASMRSSSRLTTAPVEKRRTANRWPFLPSSPDPSGERRNQSTAARYSSGSAKESPPAARRTWLTSTGDRSLTSTGRARIQASSMTIERLSNGDGTTRASA